MEAWPSFASPPPPPPPQPWALVETAQPAERSIADSEFRCLALTVYWEAGMEPKEGQSAVAHVVLNRVGQPGFPSTICGVVHQGGRHFPCQFHWYCSGTDPTPTNGEWWAQSQAVARKALAESDPTDGALYFHQASLRPQWAAGRYGRSRVIGSHIFFRGRP